MASLRSLGGSTSSVSEWGTGEGISVGLSEGFSVSWQSGGGEGLLSVSTSSRAFDRKGQESSTVISMVLSGELTLRFADLDGGAFLLQTGCGEKK